jgi:small subunit ribosomal protein S19e
MTHILLVNAQKLNHKVAQELKKQKLVEPTAWAPFVKTAHAKDRLPDTQDWWYNRSAAILRSIAKLGPVGTEKLRTKYGSSKNRGHKPSKFYPASGNIIRKILQQLEKSALVKQTEKSNNKGRILTPKGKSFLDKIAVQVHKESRKEEKA